MTSKEKWIALLRVGSLIICSLINGVLQAQVGWSVYVFSATLAVVLIVLRFWLTINRQLIRFAAPGPLFLIQFAVVMTIALVMYGMGKVLLSNWIFIDLFAAQLALSIISSVGYFLSTIVLIFSILRIPIDAN